MSAKVKASGTNVMFWCPGCDSAHGIETGPTGWAFNGDTENPTFTPSVLVYAHQTLVDDTLPVDLLTQPENITQTARCHTFVTNGAIQFLSDSEHELAGQTVSLPDWPYT